MKKKSYHESLETSVESGLEYMYIGLQLQNMANTFTKSHLHETDFLTCACCTLPKFQKILSHEIITEIIGKINFNFNTNTNTNTRNVCPHCEIGSSINSAYVTKASTGSSEQRGGGLPPSPRFCQVR